MTEAIFFVVRRVQGPKGSDEIPSLYYDRLPDSLTRKQPGRVPALIYGVRLDRLTDPRWSPTLPLAELYATYVLAKEYGGLPLGNLADPPREQEAAKPLVGHREKFKRSWDATAPYAELDPDKLQPKPEAPAFVRSEPDG